METKAEYTMAHQTPITCPICSATLGEVVEIDGRAWLRIGGLELYAAHGRCRCGGEWHWTASEVLLRKLIEKVKCK